MTHSVVGNRFRSVKIRSGLSYTLSLVLLPWLVACAGDLDPKFGMGGTNGSATGGASGTGGSGTGTGGSGAGGAGAACDALGMVFSKKCVTSCHEPGGLGMPLDLSTAAAAKAVVGTAQTYPCTADKTSKLINSTAPVSGSLILVVSGNTCSPGGGQMPLGATATNGLALSADEIACIKSYYTAQLK